MGFRGREEFVETVCDTEKYRVDKVLYHGTFGETSEMWKLSLKVKDKLVPIRRWEAWDFYLEQIKRKAEVHDVNRGFFCAYGKGDPFKEFEENDLRDFTYISDDGTAFGGNHETYSGAFRYHIWNQEIAEKIRQKLNDRNQTQSHTRA